MKQVNPVLTAMYTASSHTASSVGNAAGGTLVAVDASFESVAGELGFLAADAPATIVAVSSRIALPADGPFRRYIAPPVFVWHTEAGRSAHRELEEIAENVAGSISTAVPCFTQLQGALKFQLLDRFLYPWLFLKNVEAEVQRFSFENVVVLTSSPTVFRNVRSIVDRAYGGTSTDVPVVNRKIGVSDRIAGLLPGASSSFSRLLGTAKATLRRNFSPKSKPFGEMPAFTRNSQPAIIAWNIRDRNYITGLERLLSAVLAVRPAIVFLDSDDALKLEALKRHVESLARPASHYCLFFGYSEFLHTARATYGTLGPSVGRAVRAFAHQDHSALSALGRDLCMSEMADAMATYPHTGVLALMGSALDRILETTRPAYGICCSARSAHFAAIAGKLAAVDCPTMDVNTYLIGNHARQLMPPTRFFGAIDDQQEALISENWHVPPQDILRVGYLWRQPSHAGNRTASDVAGPGLRKTVLVCTQPGEPVMIRDFLANILDVIALDDRLNGLIKPHPAEPQAFVEIYDELIRARGLCERVRVLPSATAMTSLYEKADLVITRTSNVGIEAALESRPTIRYLEFDRYDPGVISSVEYAANVLSRPDLERAMHDLLFNDAEIAALQLKQLRYMEENPAQARADGAERIVRFFEARAIAPS